MRPPGPIPSEGWDAFEAAGSRAEILSDLVSGLGACMKGKSLPLELEITLRRTPSNQPVLAAFVQIDSFESPWEV